MHVPLPRRANSPALVRVVVSAAFLLAIPALWEASASAGETPGRPIDFNREIRPILSNACFFCHGPDANKRKGATKPLRLDEEKGAFADLGGYTAIVRGKPDESELVARIISDDPGEVMPPAVTGKKLSKREIALLTEWVKQGAPFAKHWSYVKPERPSPPAVQDKAWVRNPIDQFVLHRLEREKLKPSAEADRFTLIRRLSLDLTGLPPTWEEAEAFARDKREDAYEKLVDRLLEKGAYGEHWARTWLDLARYADSAGYADDPARTIWAYRDYVIRSLNQNKPFDQFTTEQLAGDLLPNPSEDQLVATAFHRNTLTNNEGGTNDEEYRNVAIVDRVNTTFAVWMGTTMACAQCHDHKYDPLSQEEYFRFFAFFNNTADADVKDESPLLMLYTDEQKARKATWQQEIAALEKTLVTPTPELLAGQDRWEKNTLTEPNWNILKPGATETQSGAKLKALDDGSILAESIKPKDVYTVQASPEVRKLTALRLEALTDDSLPGKGPGHGTGNFVVSRIHVTVTPPSSGAPVGRFVRVELPGTQQILSLAEVQVFQGQENVARRGEARQSTTDFEGPAALAIDGNTNGDYFAAKSTTHSAISDNPWWEVDLKSAIPIDRVVVWNRTDGNIQSRLNGARVEILNEKREVVATQKVAKAPMKDLALTFGGARPLTFVRAFADYSQPSFDAASVLDNKDVTTRGWAVGGDAGKAHALTLVASAPITLEPGSTLTVKIDQLSKFPRHTLGRFRLSVSDDPRAGEFAQTPESVLAALKTAPEVRTPAQRDELTRHYLAVVAPDLKASRDRLASLKKQLADMKPDTTVPIQRELAAAQRRVTKVQRRGNFLELAQQVAEGTPAAFPALPAGAPLNRLTLAKWLMDENNPLTPRVLANRYWEQIFGEGLVPTSEEFGSQGEPPTHPELLDWLATELIAEQWDLKRFLKLLVTSATYRQSSKMTPELLKRDSENVLLARGPRYRLSAETVRDQALAVAGLLSPKIYGPPVKPPQPSSGLNAAFGGGIDWQTSLGDDRYRRAIYTTWRRSNPYPSMTTFDAPNREVCTVRRSRTNTPLQALVTLNDPVYVEASQAIARRIAANGTASTADKARFGFRICVARDPSQEELDRLTRLYDTVYPPLAADREKAKPLATDPLGPAPASFDVAELAAWTVVGNVLLNLDEMLMRP